MGVEVASDVDDFVFALGYYAASRSGFTLSKTAVSLKLCAVAPLLGC
jgi:hypothetical protein